MSYYRAIMSLVFLCERRSDRTIRHWRCFASATPAFKKAVALLHVLVEAVVVKLDAGALDGTKLKAYEAVAVRDAAETEVASDYVDDAEKEESKRLNLLAEAG